MTKFTHRTVGKALFAAALTLCTVASASAATLDTQEIVAGQIKAGVRHVNAAEAQTILAQHSDIVVIDVRTAKEYKKFHIKGAQNIDYYADNFKALVAKLDPSITYLIHCKSGYRSGKSAPIMQSVGIKNIIHLDGGMDGWLDENFNVEH